MRAATLAVLATACSGASTQFEDPTNATRATTTTVSEPPATTAPGAPDSTGPTSTVPAPGADYRWGSGDCFDFGRTGDLAELPYAPYGTEALVGCEELHTHEVFHVDVHPESQDDPLPAGFNDRVAEVCSQAFESALGLAWPDSTYSIIRYLPDEQEWADGERYLACVLYRPSQGGTIERLDRPAQDTDPAWRTTVGACYAGDLGIIRQAPAVDCDQRHVFEVIADDAHPAPAGDPYPGDDELATFMENLCDEALDNYAASASAPIGTLPLFFTSAEWELGYRRVVCVAAATDGDDVFEVAGSFAGEWEIVGILAGDVVSA